MATRSADFRIVLTSKSTLQHTLEDSQVASVTLGTRVLNKTLSNGIGSEETNRAWENRDVTISSGATLDIDLYDYGSQDIGAGTGRDGVGLLLTMEEVVCLVIHQTAGPGQLEVMPTAPAGAVTWIPDGVFTVANGGALKSGGVLLFYEDAVNAYDINDGVSHILRLGASGGDVTLDLYVAGRHDDDLSSSSSTSTQSSSSSSSSTGSSSSTS